MQKPTTVYLGHIPIKVTHHKSLPEDAHGLYHSSPEPWVQVAARGPVRLSASTELHEMIHCIEDTYNLELTEGDVRSLEFGLVNLIVQNPEWFDGIVKRLRDDS